jgi:hypothetical protein
MPGIHPIRSHKVQGKLESHGGPLSHQLQSARLQLPLVSNATTCVKNNQPSTIACPLVNQCDGVHSALDLMAAPLSLMEMRDAARGLFSVSIWWRSPSLWQQVDQTLLLPRLHPFPHSASSTVQNWGRFVLESIVLGHRSVGLVLQQRDQARTWVECRMVPVTLCDPVPLAEPAATPDPDSAT